MKQTIHYFYTVSLFIVLTLVSYFAVPSQAQDSGVTINPNPVDTLFEADLSNPDLLLKSLAQVTNTSEDTLVLQWSRTILDMPTDWVTQVCDFNLCWDAIVSSNVDMELGIDEPLVLAPGESSNLDVYIQPKGVAGMAEVTLTITDATDPEEVFTTATYQLEVRSTTTSTTSVPLNKIQLYPNPATDFLRLTADTDVTTVTLYNLVGRIVKRFDTTFRTQFDISNLPDGMYLAQLSNRKGATLKTVRLIKRVPRP